MFFWDNYYIFAILKHKRKIVAFHLARSIASHIFGQRQEQGHEELATDSKQIIE